MNVTDLRNWARARLQAAVMRTHSPAFPAVLALPSRLWAVQRDGMGLALPMMLFFLQEWMSGQINRDIKKCRHKISIYLDSHP